MSGGMDILVIDDPRVARFWSVVDQYSGCPGPSRPAGTMLSFTFIQQSPDAVLWVTGNMIRNYAGRADLYLFVDGNAVNRAITYTSSLQWYDGHVFFSARLGPGTHTVDLRSDIPGIWGCGSAWGRLDAVLVGEPGP